MSELLGSNGKWVVVAVVGVLLAMFTSAYRFVSNNFVGRHEFESTLKSIDDRLGRIEKILMER